MGRRRKQNGVKGRKLKLQQHTGARTYTHREGKRRIEHCLPLAALLPTTFTVSPPDTAETLCVRAPAAAAHTHTHTHTPIHTHGHPHIHGHAHTHTQARDLRGEGGSPPAKQDWTNWYCSSPRPSSLPSQTDARHYEKKGDRAKVKRNEK